jgi:hypothetical protein
MQELVIGGKYRHYRGGIAEIICIAKHTESVEDLVVYKYEYAPDDTIHDFHYPFWARPKGMFFDEVEVNGEMVSRFTSMEE